MLLMVFSEKELRLEHQPLILPPIRDLNVNACLETENQLRPKQLKQLLENVFHVEQVLPLVMIKKLSLAQTLLKKLQEKIVLQQLKNLMVSS
jgi:hypothetical protein